MADAAPAGGFALYPAIDLRRGRCVRLRQGDAGRETVYGDDPLQVARAFAAAGAEWVHVVDLDAAFGDGSNRALIARIAADVPLKVQTGGGVRSDADLEAVLGPGGAARAVVGTAALEDPELVRRAVERWGAGRLAVGLDARGRRPAARGWTEETGDDLFEVARRLVEAGARTLVYTDIERDGMMAGPNLDTSAELAAESGAEVIVSGGVRGVDDVEAVRARARGGDRLVGAIVGRALYEGSLDLAAALRAARR